MASTRPSVLHCTLCTPLSSQATRQTLISGLTTAHNPSSENIEHNNFTSLKRYNTTRSRHPPHIMPQGHRANFQAAIFLYTQSDQTHDWISRYDNSYAPMISHIHRQHAATKSQMDYYFGSLLCRPAILPTTIKHTKIFPLQGPRRPSNI